MEIPDRSSAASTPAPRATQGAEGVHEDRWGRYPTAGVAVGYLLGRVVLWLALVGTFIVCGLALTILSAAFGNVFSARR
jgi:hypothetical protein